MQEFEQKILEQYDIEVNSTRKVRGAVLCETNKGVILLKSSYYTKIHLIVGYLIHP